MTSTVTDPERNGSKQYKEIGDLDSSSEKGCIHDWRVKNDHHLPPKKIKNARDPFIQSSKHVKMRILLV